MIFLELKNKMNTKEQKSRENYDLCCIFAATVHTTLPIRTASQGVSFAFKRLYLNPTRSGLAGFFIL
ncbi:hypothetical protein DHB64_15410 [Antarcticibacterium sp. W02-3]|nr:hypothetical protein [Antarcticibacterium sp. W02-3]